MTDLIDTTEMYLRTIIELEEENIIPLRARISERLGHSGPTVSQTIARMERDGLVIVTDDRNLLLTEEGRHIAVHVMRKHRLAERLLADVLGLELEYVHDEACRWEHVMSEQVERRILALIDNPQESPYGNPIPGLEELGVEPAGDFMEGVATMVELLDQSTATDQPRQGIVRRLGEPIQKDPEQLRTLINFGLIPGQNVTFLSRGNLVAVSLAKSSEILELPQDIAVHVFIEHTL